MADHEIGSMDISDQEKTYAGFIKWVKNSTIVILFVVVLLAMFRI